MYSTANSLELRENPSQFILLPIVPSASGRSKYSTALSLKFIENRYQFIRLKIFGYKRYSTAESCLLLFTPPISLKENISIFELYFNFHLGNENSIISSVKSLGNIFIFD